MCKRDMKKAIEWGYFHPQTHAVEKVVNNYTLSIYKKTLTRGYK